MVDYDFSTSEEEFEEKSWSSEDEDSSSHPANDPGWSHKSVEQRKTALKEYRQELKKNTSAYHRVYLRNQLSGEAIDCHLSRHQLHLSIG